MPTIPIPIKPVIAPASFPAAVCIASAVALVILPAIINGFEPTLAASSISLIFFISSSVSVMGLSAIFSTEIPRFSAHSCLSASFIAAFSSFAFGRYLSGPQFKLSKRTERRLKSIDKLYPELIVDLIAGKLLCHISAQSRIEEQRIGDNVGINAVAADLNCAAQPDALVRYLKNNRIRRAEFVVDYLFGIKVVDALILSGVAAVGKALTDSSEGLLDAITELAGENRRFCRTVIYKFARLCTYLDYLSLLDDHHALSVGNGDAGAVCDDIVITLYIRGTTGYLLLSATHENVIRKCITVEKFLPLIRESPPSAPAPALISPIILIPFMFRVSYPRTAKRARMYFMRIIAHFLSVVITFFENNLFFDRTNFHRYNYLK